MYSIYDVYNYDGHDGSASTDGYTGKPLASRLYIYIYEYKNIKIYNFIYNLFIT